MKIISACILSLICIHVLYSSPQEPFSYIAPEEILKVSAEMKHFLIQNQYPQKRSEGLMNRLLFDMISPEGLGFTYDKDITTTASEAFKTRRGNCLSFAYLFTALSRELGFETSFNKVIIPSNFLTKKSIVVETGHLNVIVRIHGVQFVVDPRTDYQNMMYGDEKLLPDKAAFAAYYNNLAVDKMANNEIDFAQALFKQAHKLDSESPSILRNIGLFYRNQGQLDIAEDLLLKSAKKSEKKAVIYFILNKFYEDTGNDEKAEKYLKKAKFHKRKNPFYYHHEGLQLAENKEFKSAVKRLKKAIKLGKECHFFYYDLAMIYERMGEKEKMIETLEKAIKYASTESIENKYIEKRNNLIKRYFNQIPSTNESLALASLP